MERLFEILRDDVPLPPSEVNIERAMRAGRRRVRGRMLSVGALVVAVLSVVSVVGLARTPGVETAQPPGAEFDPLRRVITLDSSVASMTRYETARHWQQAYLATEEGVGDLTVFAPGRPLVDDAGHPIDPKTGTPADPVQGRPAYWIKLDDDFALAWQWTDGGWAFLSIAAEGTYIPARDAMARVASAVRVTAGSPVTTPFTMPRPEHRKFVGTDTSFMLDPRRGTYLVFAADDPTHPDEMTYPNLVPSRPTETRIIVGVDESMDTGAGHSNRTVDGHLARVSGNEISIYDVIGRFDIRARGSADGETLFAIGRTVRLVPNPADESTWTDRPLR
ncbi:hypothetical protein [Actinophytocola sp.]|uniref:hypothetical protein n=1 Tax=Actinophytocola sp. TaxID=1872138 RepID=UPI00389A2520